MTAAEAASFKSEYGEEEMPKIHNPHSPYFRLYSVHEGRTRMDDAGSIVGRDLLLVQEEAEPAGASRGAFVRELRISPCAAPTRLSVFHEASGVVLPIFRS